MTIYRTRMTVPAYVGFVFGLFFTLSCSNLFQTGTSTDETGNLQDLLVQVNNELSEDPNNQELNLEKAQILYQISLTEPSVPQRKPFYRTIRDISDQFFSAQGTDRSQLDDLIKKVWALEQGEGIRLLQQSPDVQFDQNFNTIIAHFDNALTILPDSLVTYNLKATTYYKHGNINKAIETLEHASQRASASDTDIREKMAYLYLESGDIEQSILEYESLVNTNPADPHLRHGLANAYILNRQHQAAINTLRHLTDTYPSRYEYKEALATEMFFLFQSEVNDAASPVTPQATENLLESFIEIDNLFENLNSSVPSNHDSQYRMATFYSKAADLLHQLSLKTDETTDLHTRISNLREKTLGNALSFWERLAEASPDNMNYLYNLYVIYDVLEMNEEAESLQRSYNF